MSADIIFVVQLIGVIAFAISGALIAIDKKMDIFGVTILGVVTAIGGGVLRDLILGITPPLIFVDPAFPIIAIVTSIIIFLRPVRKFVQKEEEVFDIIVFLADSIGLASFVVLGIQTAYRAFPDSTVFLLCFAGLVSGTGGSVIRDVLAGNTPHIFVKHFYACAALIGAMMTVLLWNRAGEALSMVVGASVIIILRLFASYFKWSLPHA